MRAAFPVLGCAVGLETCGVASSLGPDRVYCGCDELIMLCLKARFDGMLEVALYGSTWSRKVWVNPQYFLQQSIECVQTFIDENLSLAGPLF
jgi:hypothetical protein